MNEIIVHLPPISDDQVSHDLVWLTEHLMKTQGAETSGGFLGGEFGYGAYFENDVFMMHPYCWCEQDDCPWCIGCECGDEARRYLIKGPGEYIEVAWEAWRDAYDPERPDTRKSELVPEKACDLCNGVIEPAPNFLHKPSGSKVSWYKYIGRSMEVELQADWRDVLGDCVASLGPPDMTSGEEV